MITFVSFQRPVTFVSVGTDYWSASDNKFKDIKAEDKGNHLQFTTTIQGKVRRIRVPLTNIAQVTEDLDSDAPKGKEKP